MKTFVIRKGIFTYALISVWLVIAAWLLFGFVRIIFEQFNPSTAVTLGNLVGGLLFTSLIGSAFLFIGLQLLSQRYVVSPEGIDVRRLRGSRFVSWDEVEVFGEQANSIAESSYKVRLRDGKTVTFFTAFMAHSSQSAKALIEAAYLSGANIEFKFVLGNEFGSPPYGIFGTEKIAR